MSPLDCWWEDRNGLESLFEDLMSLFSYVSTCTSSWLHDLFPCCWFLYNNFGEIICIFPGWWWLNKSHFFGVLCFFSTSHWHCTMSPVEPEAHTRIVWWRRVGCGGFGGSPSGVPLGFPVSSLRRRCRRWSGTAPSGLLCLFCLLFFFLSVSLTSLFSYLTIRQFTQRRCRTFGVETSAEASLHMRKGRKESSTRWNAR